MEGRLLSESVRFTAPRAGGTEGPSVRVSPKVALPLTTLTAACQRYPKVCIPDFFKKIDQTRAIYDDVREEAQKFIEGISDPTLRGRVKEIIFFGNEGEVEEEFAPKVIDLRDRVRKVNKDLEICSELMEKHKSRFFTNVPFIEMVKGRVLNWASYNSEWGEILGWTSRFLHSINPDEEPLLLHRLGFSSYSEKIDFIIKEVCKRVRIHYLSEEGVKIREKISAHPFVKGEVLSSSDLLKELTITVVDNFLYISVVSEFRLNHYQRASAERGNYSGPIDLL